VSRKDYDILKFYIARVKTSARDKDCPRICDLLGNFTVRNVPEDRRSHLHSDARLRSLKSFPNEDIPRQAKMALGVPGRLSPRIFSTFSTTKVVGRHPKAPTAFIPGEIPGTHFQRLSRPQGTWFSQKESREKSQVTSPGIDPGIIRRVAQRLNHYATPGPESSIVPLNFQ
jgi:hypothetical protein